MADDLDDIDAILSDENFDFVGQSSQENIVSDSACSEDFVDDFDDAWHAELEDALLEGFVDHTIIRNICKCRILPPIHRAEVWKICLNIASRGNALNCWDGKLDLTEQNQIHEACEKIVDQSKTEDIEQALANLELIITFYCKSRAIKYDNEYAWTFLLQPMLELPELDRADLYNCFYAMLARYIPRESLPDAPYNLFRLILLYHDPELCSFLDSRKLTMQMFMKPWLRTLFASHCKRPVTLALWDIYLQRADPFFMFFLALVILVNAKEQVMNTMLDKQKNEIADALTEFPVALETVDVEDFCQLAMYFSDKTPQSVRKGYQDALFSGPMSLSGSKESTRVERELAQSLCIQVAVPDILLSAQPDFSSDERSESNQVRFFLVDCRSPDLYNAGHLSTAFHLDATLMLREPAEFKMAIDALSNAQEQAIQAGSAAGGEHLCLIGSGVDEEDQYMYMVIAHLLKNHRSYISVVRGGFKSIITYLSDVNINLSEWITGTSSPKQLLNLHKSSEHSFESAKENAASSSSKAPTESGTMESFMKNLSITLKSKSHNIKEKVTKFIENTHQEDDMSHMNTNYNGKPYRGTQPVFSIGDEDEHNAEEPYHNLPKKKEPVYEDSDVDEDELVDLDEWFKQHNVKNPTACFLVLQTGRRFPAHLAVDKDDMVCFREYKAFKKSKIVTRRSLALVSKITSKRSCPELITFKFNVPTEGENEDGEAKSVEEVDRYLIPEAGQATKYIKQQIMRVLDATES
uniref:TBC1 domain family member 23-like n=1 Tax=Styela clava TaxID=7725 RepID=UPI001939DC37|nr:TBC1 domain family member 23-like [Styela clava]